MSYSKRARMSLALGVFLLLSVVVFGAMFYVAYCSCNVEVLADADDGMEQSDSDLGIKEGPVHVVSHNKIGIRRGPIEIVPFYNPDEGIMRPPFKLLPI